MEAIKSNILISAYRHYKSTGRLTWLYVFPVDLPDKRQCFNALDALESDGYIRNVSKAIGSAYVTLTDYALDCLSES